MQDVNHGISDAGADAGAGAGAGAGTGTGAAVPVLQQHCTSALHFSTLLILQQDRHAVFSRFLEVIAGSGKGKN